MSALLAARHAPVAAHGLCYGRADLAAVLADADAAARIAAGLARPPGAVWSSPSRRCRGPAALLAARFAAPLGVDPRLHELDFGAWDGLAWADIERDDGDRLRAWTDDWTRAAPPDGETIADLAARVRAWLADLPRATDHLLVAHAGVVRALAVLLEGCDWPAAMAMQVPHLEPRVFALPARAP